jgi:hypothetical protein
LILLINCTGDPLCIDLLKGLMEHGHPAQAIPDLYRNPAKISWWLDTDRSATSYRLETDAVISDLGISGVFVRRSQFVQKEGWAFDEAAYVYAEKEAALFGWIWGLPCPVVNRYPPELWFAPVESLEFWRGRLERFDLQLGPISSGQVGPCYPVAVIGSRVVWDQGAPGRFERMNDSLVRFAESLGLSYLEFRIADSMGKPEVAGVEPFPKYDLFCTISRREIINELIGLLARSKSPNPLRNGSDSWF